MMTTLEPSCTRPGTRLRSVLLALAVVTACGAVFLAWLNPHLAVELSTLVRACF